MTRNGKFLFGFILVFSLFSVSSFFIEGASISQSWLENSTFDTSDGWFFNIEGDQNDVNGIIENGFGKLSILGERGNKTFFENGTGWTIRQNEDDMTQPNDFDIRDNGWWATHYWPDNQPQLLRVQWERNFTMGVNMSDYKITSASFETWINASVNSNVECINDTSGIDDIGNGDYIRYFVYISDVARNREFELTSYQTTDLGCDSGPITQLNDKKLVALSESTLKFYLEEVLKYDSYNFSMTVGFLLWCEDNINPQDIDQFNDIYMKNLSLSIIYEKNIDQLTKISLNQVGEEISGSNIRITKANLTFSLNFTQSQSFSSKLSELILRINDNIYVEKSTKLIDINSTFHQFSRRGLDVTNYIQKDEPISISFEVFLKEDFQLNETASLFIDDVYLFINIEEITTQDWTPLIIALIIGIISAISIFGAYNRYFKYSPIERKVRKLRKKIKKNKKVKKIDSIRNKSQIGQSKYSKRIEILNLKEENIPNQNINVQTKKKNLLVLLWILIIIFLGSFSIMSQDKQYPNKNSFISLSSGPISEQWLENNNFSTQLNWFKTYGLIGNQITLDTNIGNGEAKFLVLGQENNFIACSGVPNNTETSSGWINATNPQITAKPSRGYLINESGCFASHEWAEGSGFGDELRAQQNTAIQWDNQINIQDDMSDYIITDANFKIKVNATVSALSGEVFPQPNSNSGLDPIESESTGGRFDIGDYLRFYAFLSNLEKNITYQVAEFVPAGLGIDNGQFDYLNDTIIEPENIENFIFYLSEVLKTDNHNFTLTLGMEFYCEDDWSTDWDYFNEVYIKECNFSFTYQKLIPKYSSISLNQITEKIPGGKVEILDAKVNISYSIESSWPENLSAFSEFRISINNNTLPRTILLKDFNTTFQQLELDAKSYIIKNKSIYFSLEVFIGNTFNYDENVTIKINQVDLFISYKYIESPTDLLPLAITMTIGLISLLIGIGAYQLFFKYPPLVRKIRKLKRKIRKNKKTKTITINKYQEYINNIYQDKKEILKTPQLESNGINKTSK
ncbi:MAG: hypothetical protein EU542_07115 [Promethearchaeota archaeon]|nr:MAG: hypothetical protein EU542_07115 [Candidatus Lokiarchaeota archaeon]